MINAGSLSVDFGIMERGKRTQQLRQAVAVSYRLAPGLKKGTAEAVVEPGGKLRDIHDE